MVVQAVLVLLLAAGSFLLARARLREPMPRTLQFLGACLLICLLLIPLGGYDDPTVQAMVGTRAQAVSMQIAVACGGVAGLWARRRRPTPPREAFSWDAYGPAVLALLAVHWALSKAAAETQPLIDPQSGPAGLRPEVTWLANTAFEGLAVLLMSQVSISLLLRMLSKALTEDWTFAAVGGWLRRKQYLLAGVPVLLCVVPALVNGAMLAGIVFRLLLLMLAWLFTDVPPSGLLQTLRALAGAAGTRRGAAPGGPPSPDDLSAVDRDEAGRRD